MQHFQEPTLYLRDAPYSCSSASVAPIASIFASLLRVSRVRPPPGHLSVVKSSREAWRWGEMAFRETDRPCPSHRQFAIHRRGVAFGLHEVSYHDVALLAHGARLIRAVSPNCFLHLIADFQRHERVAFR